MVTTPKNRNNWKFGNGKPIIKNKERIFRFFMDLFFNRTLSMFEYENLPEELPVRQIELLLQTYGFAVFPKELINGKHYVMYGGLGFEPDAYYQPSKAILVNPYLKYNKILDIEKKYADGECVVVHNDMMHSSLLNLHELYAGLLAENIISIRYGTINARIPTLVTADNDVTKESAKDYFDKVESGEDYGIIAGTPFFNNLKTDEYGRGTDSTHIKELIEEQQYLKSSWWNDLGVNANFNMKREAINESEASMGELALLPYIDNMLLSRQNDFELLNKLWGTNIKVKLSSAWAKLRKQIEIDEQVEESQIQTPAKTGEEPVKESTENDEN